jgi:hypothetical protein
MQLQASFRNFYDCSLYGMVQLVITNYYEVFLLKKKKLHLRSLHLNFFGENLRS